MRDEYEEDKFAKVNTDLTASCEKTFHYAGFEPARFSGCDVPCDCTDHVVWRQYDLTSGLKVGDLTGFLSYVMQVMNSLMMIANVFLLLTRSLASAHRIVEVLDERIILASPQNGRKEVPDGRIDFEDVSFKYHENAKEYALSKVVLHVLPGQTVGILGGTGASKTTLVQLIPQTV